MNVGFRHSLRAGLACRWTTGRSTPVCKISEKVSRCSSQQVRLPPVATAGLSPSKGPGQRDGNLVAARSLPPRSDLLAPEAQAAVLGAFGTQAPYEEAVPKPEGAFLVVDSDSPLSNFWRSYNQALEERPVLVKSATSFFGFLIGDIIAQNIVGLPFDYWRTFRLVAFGIFMDGPVGHVWYTTLDRNVMPEDPKSNKAVISKMLLDQLLWAPAFSCVFFAFINILDGHPELVIPCIQTKLLPMLLANYAIWPLAHLINFKYVPSQQRILYINCVQILWSAYLSHLSAGALRSVGLDH